MILLINEVLCWGWKWSVFFCLFVFCSCGSEKLSYDNFSRAEKEINICLSQYDSCFILMDQIKTINTPIAIFLKAKWEIRKSEYAKADTLLKSIDSTIMNLPVESKLFQEFVLVNVGNKNTLGHFHIAYEDEILQRVNEKLKSGRRSINKNLIKFKIQILLEKSAKLTEQNEIKYSFVTGLYAMYLSEKFDVNFTGKYQPEYFHAIKLIRELKTESAQFFFNQAADKCTDFSDPYCRKIKCLAITNTEVGKRGKLDTMVINQLLSHGQYSPQFDDFIELQARYFSDDLDASIKWYKSKLKGGDYCESNFINTIYLIDILFEKKDLDEADTYLEYVRPCKKAKDNNEYYRYYRDQKYHLLRYKKTKNEHDVLKAFQLSCKTKEISLRKFVNNQSLHYADFIFNNNNTIIESIYELLQHENGNLKPDDIIRQLIEGKEMFDHIANTAVLFEWKEASDSLINKYSAIQSEIHSIELKTNEYTDTIFTELSIYESLYFLYEDLYKIKKNIKKGPPLFQEKETSYARIHEYLKQTNTQVVDIIATEKYYYFSFIRPDTIIVNQYSKDEVDNQISTLREVIMDRTSLSDDKVSSEYLLNLIQPYLDPQLKNVIIIPDNKLYELPFEQLILSQGEGEIPTYLGDEFNVSYNYNISKVIPENGVNSLLNARATLFSYSDEVTEQVGGQNGVTELYESKMEIRGIDSLYHQVDTFLGLQFTKQNISNSLNSPIIHFATHSSSNPDNYLDNYLYLRDEKGQPMQLFGFEIKNKKLNNSLVMLSSCNSGTGQYKSGAGTFSLSRDFLQAGAQTVIKSLWRVEDISTSILMINFHKNLQMGHTTSMALSLAKRKLKQIPQYAHPYYWAGFILEGNPTLRLGE